VLLPICCQIVELNETGTTKLSSGWFGATSWLIPERRRSGDQTPLPDFYRATMPLCILWCIPGFLRNEWNHAFKLVGQE
jgi:hypothetical protein